MLLQFVASHPVLYAGKVLKFADDGWSETNFERLYVKQLLDLVKRGGVQCVIVRDLFRWGRNYIDVNEHIEQISPFLEIRFISLSDRYDSDD